MGLSVSVRLRGVAELQSKKEKKYWYPWPDAEEDNKRYMTDENAGLEKARTTLLLLSGCAFAFAFGLLCFA